MTPNLETYKKRVRAHFTAQHASNMEALRGLWLEARLLEQQHGDECNAFETFLSSFSQTIATTIVNVGFNVSNHGKKSQHHSELLLRSIEHRCKKLVEEIKDGTANISNCTITDITSGKPIDYDFRNHLNGSAPS